jgi:hypothetical protein
MKKSFIASIALALVATSAGALADDAVSGQSSGMQQQPQTQTQIPAQHGQAQQAPVITSTTMVTSAGGTGASPALDPSASTRPERDTVTLYQSYRPNKAYLITGSALLVGTYVPTAVITASEDEDRSLYIPVAGPWIALADRPDDASTTSTALIIGSGALQGVGALMTLASFFIPEKVPAATIQAGDMKFHMTPMASGRGSAGIGAIANF